MKDQNGFVAHPFAGVLWVKKGAQPKKLSDKVTLLDRDDHTFTDLKVEGLDGFTLKFNEKTRSLTVRQDAPEPKAEASTIDKEFAAIANGDSFTLDDGPTAEEKFKAVCQERGYDADLAKRVREIIAQHGASEAVKNRLNDLLKARKAKVLRKEDWAVAQELTAK